LVVEVTEHAPISDYGAIREAMSRLQASGCRLAVDDAGAGFASLRHILELKPAFIKLDISLTRGIDSNRDSRALSTALLSFADSIGANIIAEGIETESELLALLTLGVRFGQGFLLGRPAPASDLMT
jgi:EAL domain-containing protein (putative c-di-GMP-specific phosphodiesterase class I)